MQNTFKVYFPIQNVSTDAISSIGTASFPQGTTASSLSSGNPQYWMEKNIDGEMKLCTTKTDLLPLNASLLDGAGNPYVVKALAFEVLDYVGGHPIHRPGQS